MIPVRIASATVACSKAGPISLDVLEKLIRLRFVPPSRSRRPAALKQLIKLDLRVRTAAPLELNPLEPLLEPAWRLLVHAAGSAAGRL